MLTQHTIFGFNTYHTKFIPVFSVCMYSQYLYLLINWLQDIRLLLNPPRRYRGSDRVTTWLDKPMFLKIHTSSGVLNLYTSTHQHTMKALGHTTVVLVQLIQSYTIQE